MNHIRCTPFFPLALAVVPFLAACSPAGAQSAQERWSQPELEKVTREIQAQVEVVRGEKFKRPVAVRVADRQQFIAYAKQRSEMTETPEKIQADETIAKLLGVIPPDMDLYATGMKLLESQVGGFYDPASQSFSLMDACPKGAARIILAHELDHALDDQLYGIDEHLKKVAQESDATFAYQAVVEGSGTDVMTRWVMTHRDGLDLSSFESLQRESDESMAAAPMWLWKPLVAAYLRGAAFLARTDAAMGASFKGAANADIERAFRSPPRSTEQILHPEKYWDQEKLDEPVLVRFAAADPPAGWKVLREDTLGEFLLAMVCTTPAERTGLDVKNAMAMIAMEYTNAAAAGWGGDRVILLGKEGARYLQLVARWDTPRDASEFFGALTVQLPTFRAGATGLPGAPRERTLSGAEVAYGADEREVVLRVWAGVEKRDLKALDKALTHAVAER